MAKKPKKDASAEAEEGSVEAPKKSRRPLLIGLAAAMLLGAGTGGYAVLFRGKPAEAESAGPDKKPVTMLDVREMTVNLLAEPNQERARFLKFSVALEVGDPKLAAEIRPLLPRVEDALQVLLRQLRPADLEGSAGMYRLREELLRRVNLAVYPAKVDAILFKDLIVQ